MKKFITILGLSLSLPLSLQGCFVVGAAAGAAAITAVYDHRTIANAVEDTKITNKIVDKIYRHPGLKNESHIEVSVFNGVVLLTGETPNPAWRQEMDDMAKSTPEVKKVYNYIIIQGPSSSITRTSDSWITAKIKGQMLATDDLKSGSIKVLTQDGTVYLMGMVTREQADTSVDIARDVSGVHKVIKIFQYKK